MNLSDVKPTKSFIDSIVDRYKAKSAEFEVGLPGGESLRFRAVADHGELESLKERSADFIKLVVDGKVDNLPAYQGIVVKHPKTVGLAFCMAELSIEPKMEPADALRLAKEVPYVFESIVRQIDLYTAWAANSSDLEGVEAAKNESEPTSDSGTDS